MVRKRILMVEDSAIVSRIQQAQLGGLFVEVQTAVNGDQALEMALSRPPDLLVVDLVMPGMDGFALCQALKGDPRTAKVPLFVVTALARDAKDRAFASGADDFMRKPPSTLLLQHRVSNLLEIGAAEEEGLGQRGGPVVMRVVSPQAQARAHLVNQGGASVRGEEFSQLEGLLERLRQAPLGLLVLDAAFGLPQIRQVVEQLREDPGLVETPVLLLYAKDDLAILEGNPPAVDDFLEKPLEAGATRHRVGLMARLARARRRG
jgi:CheY-like chemotaxis protein